MVKIIKEGVVVKNSSNIVVGTFRCPLCSAEFELTLVDLNSAMISLPNGVDFLAEYVLVCERSPLGKRMLSGRCPYCFDKIKEFDDVHR